MKFAPHRFWSAWLLCMFAAAGLAGRVEPGAYAGGRARDEEERVRRNSSALAAMVGEFRASISDMMFVKTERYLHAGVYYLPHHGESALSAEDLAAEVDEHQRELGIPDGDDEEHSGIPTLIPTPEADFRGWVGNLHRQVQPWRDPKRAHVHTDGRELLPWFRLMTRMDPHYERGYVAGAYWLQALDNHAALHFIDEGLTNNPDAFQLFVSRGFVLLRIARESDDPGRLNDALSAFLQGAELALLQRPDEVDEYGFGPGGWGSYHENDAIAAANMSVMLTDRLGDPERARALRNRFKLLVSDHVLP